MFVFTKRKDVLLIMLCHVIVYVKRWKKHSIVGKVLHCYQ